MSEDLLKQFEDVTSASHDIAEQYLARNGNDMAEALNDYYRDTEGRKPTPAAEPKEKSDRKFRSMAEIRDAEERPMDDDDDEKNFFTGGEKSGLQVENPDNQGDDDKEKSPMNLVEDLLKKAEREAGQPDTREPIKQPKAPKFKGAGYKLGSVEDKIESSKIEDPNAVNRPQIPEKVTRKITFWKEGFQVDEGKLYRYDDPANSQYLDELNQGRAPLGLLNVQMFQDVDVQVVKKLDESFKPPKRKAGGFIGEGRRLGSPIPGEPIVVGGLDSQKEQQQETEEEQEEKQEEKKEEEGSGDARIQIRLAHGERIVHGFNSSDTVSAIFDFVADKTEDTRPWTLATTFPMKLLDTMKDQTIAESGLANSVVVQRHK